MKNILVDKRNIADFESDLLKKCLNTNLIGFDIETFQTPHEGLVKLMKIDTDGFTGNSKKLVFDYKRSVVTGTSWYFGDEEVTYYINFNHADVENRLPMSFLFEMLDNVKKNDNTLIIHNAAYELAVFLGSYNYDLPNTLCSMQLCVTAYNPDTYNPANLSRALSDGIKPLIPEIERQFANFEKGELTAKQWEVLGKFLAKTGDASHSYEGIVKGISYGYGLKKAVKSWFGHQMDDFKKTLGDSPNMGALTGEQVTDYGCEDAYWCYKLFMKIYTDLNKTNPLVIQSYLDTENPMTRVFAAATVAGMKVNLPAIYAKRTEMRTKVSDILVQMKVVLREIMPESLPPLHERLLKYEKWYKPESNLKYFEGIRAWLKTPDNVSEYELCTQVRNSIGNAWADDQGLKPKGTMSVNHYMFMRYVLAVICGLELKVEQGKIQSDKEARAAMGDHPILALYAELGTYEQAVKLYITQYLMLTDPTDEFMHPVMSCLLATRRMSCQNPNGNQLAKRGDSVYVRGYFTGDTPDHLVVSADYSAVELVMAGELSGDAKFAEAYSQLPHDDLHSEAAAGVLGISREEFNELPNKKDLRTEVGKGANFEFTYSKWLTNTARKMGWTFEETVEAVKGYCETFSGLVAWIDEVQGLASQQGYIQMPDHHKRIRYELTEAFAFQFMDVFDGFGSESISAFARQALRKIQTRAGNQITNAMIQGTCATLLKRATLSILKDMPKHLDVRLLMLTHDECIWNVHKDHVIEFNAYLLVKMRDGQGLVNNLKLDSSISVGKTYEPFDKVKAMFGQVELMEIQKGVSCVDESSWGRAATLQETQQIIDYLVQ